MRILGINLINACKVATIASIAGYAVKFGFRTQRAWVYTALHGSYLAWWFVHQRLSPKWGPTVFPEGDLPAAAVGLIFLAVGPGYSLPGYHAFKSTTEPAGALVAASIAMFAWGSLFNCAADFYKDGAKSAQPDATVTSGPFRLARHLNYFGDWLRYGSFAVIAGCKPAAFFPLAWTMLINLAGIKERDAKKAKRGGAEAEKYIATTPAVIPWRLIV